MPPTAEDVDAILVRSLFLDLMGLFWLDRYAALTIVLLMNAEGNLEMLLFKVHLLTYEQVAIAWLGGVTEREVPERCHRRAINRPQALKLPDAVITDPQLRSQCR